MKNEFTIEISLVDPGPNLLMVVEALKDILGSDIELIKSLVYSLKKSSSLSINKFEIWHLKEQVNLISKNGVLINFFQPKPFLSLAFKYLDDANRAAKYLKHVGMEITFTVTNQKYSNQIENILINKNFLNEE